MPLEASRGSASHTSRDHAQTIDATGFGVSCTSCTRNDHDLTELILAADPGADQRVVVTGGPRESKNVPTFHTVRHSAATASQLDFVFAPETIADRVHVRALNGAGEWGPSDHCRVVIDVAST